MFRRKGKQAKDAVRLDWTDTMPLLGIVAVFVVSLLTIYGYYSYTSGRLDRESMLRKTLSARYAAGRVSRFMEHERAALVSQAGMIALAGGGEKGKSSLALYARTRDRQAKLLTLFVLDARGRFLYSYPESLVDRYMQDFSSEEFYKAVASGKDFYYSSAQDDKKGGWEVVLSAPISGGPGGKRLQGVLVERVDMKVLEPMFTGGLEPGEEGYAFLLDENGRPVAHQTGGPQYQFEGTAETLKKIARGEEGFVEMRSPYSGAPRLAVFSPVRFGGKVWSVGVLSPDADRFAGARQNFQWMLLIVAMVSLASLWSLISLTKLIRYRAAVSERAKASERLLAENRELATLNGLTRALSGTEDLDALLDSALDIVSKEMGVGGLAIKLAVTPAGALELKAHKGMPAGFADRCICPDTRLRLCGKALMGGRPVRLEGREAAASKDLPCGDLFPMGLTLVPLKGKKGQLGLLLLAGTADIGGPEYSEGFLTALGNQLSAGIENFLQVEDTKRHAARATALFHTARALTRSLDLDVLLKIIMKEAASLLKAKSCLLMSYNEEANQVDCRVALGYECPQVPPPGFSPSGVFWEAMADGRVKVVDLEEKNVELPAEFAERYGLRRFVLVPLMSKGKVLGFIVLEMPGKARASVDDLKLIVGFANQAAVAIETSSFYIRTVEKYNLDLQRLSNKIIEAQEDERKRISRDLHDELGQSLTAIKINLDMARDRLPAESDQARLRIAEATDLVVSTIESVRRLSFELRPSMLDDLGLSTVLGKLVSDFRKRYGIDVEFREDGPDERLSPEMEVVLYRVVQEALTNIAKHSGATRVSVELNKDPERGIVGLYIEDNGKGFQAQQSGRDQDTKGFGLMGIKERVSLLGGNFRIFSDGERGTRLLVDIPLTKGEQKTWKAM